MGAAKQVRLMITNTNDHKEMGVASGRLALPSEHPKQNEKSNEITAQVHGFS